MPSFSFARLEVQPEVKAEAAPAPVVKEESPEVATAVPAATDAQAGGDAKSSPKVAEAQHHAQEPTVSDSGTSSKKGGWKKRLSIFGSKKTKADA